MGTIINGNKWSGACVNGNVVSGLAKNGLIFYRKETMPSVLYKRRIMTGDNLTGKRIYFSFPDDYATIRQGKEPIGDFIVGNGSETIWENSLYEILVGEYNYVYIPDMLNSPSILSNDIGSVTNIEDCLAYRCCYVEDPNIRPVQVGDKIVSGTKFFFNIPDDYAEKVREEFGSTYTTSTSWVTSGDDKINIQWINYGYASYVVGVTLNEYGYAEMVYAWGRESYNYSTQIYEGEDTVITEVNVIDILYPEGYILVDTTTLGA